MDMTKMKKALRVAFVLSACTLAWTPERVVVATQEEGCSEFEDWRDLNEGENWHQHSSSPPPEQQGRGAEWELIRKRQADGRRHELAPGETLDDHWAHHDPCSGT